MQKQIALLIIGVLTYCGPYPNIPADAKLGEEYASSDEAEITRLTTEMVTNALVRDYPEGDLVRRDAHPKAHGCLKATFSVPADLSADLKYGLFAKPGSYKAYIRYSNGRPPYDVDDRKGNIRGMAVKVMGVPGAKVGPEKMTQDFLMINYPILPVGDVKEYYLLFKAAFEGNPFKYMVSGINPANWKLGVLKHIRAIEGQELASPLTKRYWSTTPYLWKDIAVKYSAIPCNGEKMGIPDGAGPNYLRDVMVQDLESGSGCFDFYVQFQKDPIKQPIEDAAVVWEEDETPFVKVARIEIPSQTFDTEKQNEFCENISMNPWHSLAEHRPMGGINRVRKAAYDSISKYRHEKNKISEIEPTGNEVF